MTKTALWLHPHSSHGRTFLTTGRIAHDVDTIAQSSVLEALGYDVYLHESFSRARFHSEYSKKVVTKELKNFKADAVVLFFNSWMCEFISFHYAIQKKVDHWHTKNFDAVCDFLDSFEGDLYTFINDPRPSYQKAFLKEKRKKGHRFYDHLDRSKIIVADVNFLDEQLQPRAVVSDYWKKIPLSVRPNLVLDAQYKCVYPGYKQNNLKRKNEIYNWLGRGCVEGCYTVGDIKIKNLPSISDYKKVSLEEVYDLTSRSMTALVCGEPTHTWLTPRVMQSLCQGTICSIHPDFAGRHWFPDEILRDQTFESIKDFDRSLLTEEIYQRQLNFVKELRNVKT